MVKKKGTVLLVVFTDVAVEHDSDFNAWYNQEHLPERLSAPGFLDGARYETLRGGPRYLRSMSLSRWKPSSPTSTCGKGAIPPSGPGAFLR